MTCRSLLTARWAIVALFTLSLLPLTLYVVSPAPPSAPQLMAQTVPGEIVVKFKAGTAVQLQGDLHRIGGGQVIRHLDGLGVDVVRVSTGASVALAAYQKSPHVVYAEPNYLVQASVQPNDPQFQSQWDMPKILAPFAWDLTTGDASVVVAVVDTGVAPDHPEFRSKLLPGYNVFDRGSTTQDDAGHGTHVASTVAATGDDGVGIAGLCWRCRILPVKVLDGNGTGTSAGGAEGVRWAADHGARVINMSWGMTGQSQVLADAIAYARSRGVVLVAAAGNLGSDKLFYPAALDGVIAVSATDSEDRTAAFSNYGSYIDIAAPGVQVLGATPNNGYASFSGTSMAAPHVAGAAAMMFSIRPGLTADQVQEILKARADDRGPRGWDPAYGAGRLNLYRAVAGAAATSTPLPYRAVLPIVVR